MVKGFKRQVVRFIPLAGADVELGDAFLFLFFWHGSALL
jgi:hypothetical protein